ncbi:hypothetical protein HYPSUDRAFT_203872 [Hypholoma sublateritium FD-334 SS-4]|uniref:Uncharacterized protein n=1 Tax=Hypholoma sublateritium (strain FD-334 SS-4) TaxID=945553 RepID=A0A0D2NNH9_HYPSF|nr:hypothetical protein HYPSUDRAFT_203872 [Hypholoma sublateritium FD-334 SS-4]
MSNEGGAHALGRFRYVLDGNAKRRPRKIHAYARSLFLSSAHAHSAAPQQAPRMRRLLNATAIALHPRSPWNQLNSTDTSTRSLRFRYPMRILGADRRACSSLLGASGSALALPLLTLRDAALVLSAGASNARGLLSDVFASCCVAALPVNDELHMREHAGAGGTCV